MNKQPTSRDLSLRSLAVIAIASLFIFGALVKAQDRKVDAEAHKLCNDQILTGGYGYSFSGFSGPYAGTPAPTFFGVGRVGAVGLATFDGAGGVIARDTLARSGTPAVRHAGIGTYGVHPNCTGSASINLTSDADPKTGRVDLENVQFDFMVVPGSHGREFSFIVTHQTLCAVGEACTPNLPEQTGVALSTGDEACSDASLQGTYRLVSTGTNLTRLEANAAVGFRTFDGAGQITDGTNTQLLNGAIVPAGDLTGTYTVQSDCTGTSARSVAGGGQTFDCVVVAGGRQAYFVRTQNLAITNIFIKKRSGDGVD